MKRWGFAFGLVSCASGSLLFVGCGGGGDETQDDPFGGEQVEFENPLTDPVDGPPAGNPDGTCGVPALAGPEDVSSPKTVVGDGTPESCTSQAFIDAVAGGGVITFDCGSAPHTIMLDDTARVYNDADDEVTIDGGGLITLSGSGNHRILHMDTCDESLHWTTSHCDNQDHPRLTVQNITFVDGNSVGWPDEGNRGGGGAIFAYGGRFKAVNTRFFNNVCAAEGPDVGGAGIRVFAQHDGQPAYVVNSTFGGSPELGNSCSNGGGISSIGVSWTIINSYFSHNVATGEGANPAQSGTPGGGSGGAIYNDGNTMTLALCGTLIEDNQVNAHGAAIFFVSNDKSGNIVLEDTIIQNNCGGSWYERPGISMHPETEVSETDSTLTGCEG